MKKTLLFYVSIIAFSLPFNQALGNKALFFPRFSDNAGLLTLEKSLLCWHLSPKTKVDFEPIYEMYDIGRREIKDQSLLKKTERYQKIKKLLDSSLANLPTKKKEMQHALKSLDNLLQPSIQFPKTDFIKASSTEFEYHRNQLDNLQNQLKSAHLADKSKKYLEGLEQRTITLLKIINPLATLAPFIDDQIQKSTSLLSPENLPSLLLHRTPQKHKEFIPIHILTPLANYLNHKKNASVKALPLYREIIALLQKPTKNEEFENVITRSKKYIKNNPNVYSTEAIQKAIITIQKTEDDIETLNTFVQCTTKDKLRSTIETHLTQREETKDLTDLEIIYYRAFYKNDAKLSELCEKHKTNFDHLILVAPYIKQDIGYYKKGLMALVDEFGPHQQPIETAEEILESKLSKKEKHDQAHNAEFQQLEKDRLEKILGITLVEELKKERKYLDEETEVFQQRMKAKKERFNEELKKELEELRNSLKKTGKKTP